MAHCHQRPNPTDGVEIFQELTNAIVNVTTATVDLCDGTAVDWKHLIRMLQALLKALKAIGNFVIAVGEFIVEMIELIEESIRWLFDGKTTRAFDSARSLKQVADKATEAASAFNFLDRAAAEEASAAADAVMAAVRACKATDIRCKQCVKGAAETAATKAKAIFTSVGNHYSNHQTGCTRCNHKH